MATLLGGGLLLLAVLSAARPAQAGPAAPPVLAAPTPVGRGPAQGTPTPTPNPCGLAWRVVASPNVGSGTNALAGVAVAGPNDAWAVGFAGSPRQTLTEHWNGSTWTVVPSANAGSASHLNGVAVVGPNDVWAVGSSVVSSLERTLIEHWDGSAWSVVASPSPSNFASVLNALAVAGPNDVWAVGSYFEDGPLVYEGLIEHWNGSAWSISYSPDQTFDSYLNGVAVAGPGAVWAVGSTRSISGHATLIEYWNGAAWTVVLGANPGSDNYLSGVAAAAPNDVWAVGEYVSGSAMPTLIEHWNGVAWTVAPGLLSSANDLTGVAMAAPNDVWAVGDRDTGGGPRTLTLHWNGSAWTQVASPNVGSGNNTLTGVAVAGPTNVWAAGQYHGGSVDQTLIAHYSNACATPPPPTTATATRTPATPTAMPNTTATATPNPCGQAWRVSPTLNADGSTVNFLYGVAVAGPGDVWAVGYYQEAGTLGNKTLIEHWDGHGWTIVASPNLSTIDNVLNGVVVVGSNDVWAVGYYAITYLHYQTLTEHWDGTAWTIVPSPSHNGDASSLRAVAVAGPSDIWAVGSYFDNSLLTYEALIEHWDGSGWSLVASPSVGATYNVLTGVAVAGPGAIWAVGTIANSIGDVQTLTEYWDGAAWTIVPSANPGSANILYEVAVAGPNDAWAVGSYGNPSQTLIERWNGTAWSVVPSPDLGSNQNLLTGVAVVGPADAWAVGYDDNGGGGSLTLILHWDGSAWSLVASPSPGSDNKLTQMAAASGAVWTVGYTPVDGVYKTLAEQYGEPFVDVDPYNPFYIYIRCLVCRGIISGYTNSPPCVTAPCFRPYAAVTRSQVAKIVANAAGFNDVIPPTRQTFSDVPYGSPFWVYIERAVAHGVISGYSAPANCPSGAPCFQPAANVTRGQLAKVAANAAGYSDPVPAGTQSFSDVPPGDPFWVYIERLAARGIVSGYDCGSGERSPCTGAPEACDSLRRPYYRPCAGITRGQASKVVSNTFFPLACAPGPAAPSK